MKSLKVISLFLLLITVLHAEPPIWVVDPANYEFNMSLTGLLVFDGVASEDTNDIVGAFVDGVCRGVAQPTLFPPTGRYTFGMTIYSNKEGEVISFQAYDASADKIYQIEQVQVFQSNAIIGDDMNPVELNNYVKKFTLTMQVNPADAGTTDPPVGGYLYKEGSVVDVSATPAATYAFVNWNGDVADPQAAMTSVILDTNKIITANFEQITHTLSLSVEPENSGTTQPAVGEYEIVTDSVVTLVAQPAAGYKFVQWQGDVSNPSNATTTVLMDSDKQVKAIFAAERCILTITVDPAQGGTTTPAAGEHEYDMGTEVTVEALPATDYQFVHWLGDVSEPQNASCTVVMDESKTITAVFDFPDGVESRENGAPRRYALQQNYPNPFNSSTVIWFSVPKATHVRLEIINLNGKTVSVLKDGLVEPGRFTVNWNGLDAEHKPVPSGLYLYRLQTEAFSQVRKLLYVK